MKFTVNYAPGMITTTAGNGSVSIDTPMGSGTNVSNLVPRCNCCQFCPFTDGAIYTSLPAQIKCTLTDEFHFCDDTHCDVKEKLIPIEWIRKWNIDNYPYTALLMSEIIPKMLEDWENNEWPQ